MPFRGDRLQGIREQKGLRRADLANLTGLDAAGIQHLEEGTTKNPRYSTVEVLAEKLDITPDYLGGAGPDVSFAQAIVLQALERFKRVEGPKFEPLDHQALARAAEDDDAPDTVAHWRAFMSMSIRAWGTPPRLPQTNDKADRAGQKPKLRRQRKGRPGKLIALPGGRRKNSEVS